MSDVCISHGIETLLRYDQMCEIYPGRVNEENSFDTADELLAFAPEDKYLDTNQLIHCMNCLEINESYVMCKTHHILVRSSSNEL